VHSCGIWGLDGQKPSELAIQVAKENDLDLSQHQARSLRPDIIKQADLILCMTPEHRQELIRYFPVKEKEIYTLKGFFKEGNTPDETIADPIGKSLSFYRRVFQEIESELERILPVIRQLAKKKSSKC
jgi:protein-tyrosine-phosphatase